MNKLRIRIKKNVELDRKDLNLEVKKKEYAGYVKDTQDKLYDLHRELQDLEQKKIILQSQINDLIERGKNLKQQQRSPSTGELFNYCDQLIKTSKGKLEK